MSGLIAGEPAHPLGARYRSGRYHVDPYVRAPFHRQHADKMIYPRFRRANVCLQRHRVNGLAAV
jgi:hypothetical protein